MPMIGVVIALEKTDPYGIRYSGPGLRSCPGQAHRVTSVKLSDR